MILVLKHNFQKVLNRVMSVLQHILLVHLVLKYFESAHLMTILGNIEDLCIIDWCIALRYKDSMYYWLWFRQETGDTVCRAKLCMAILQDWVSYRKLQDWVP